METSNADIPSVKTAREWVLANRASASESDTFDACRLASYEIALTGYEYNLLLASFNL